MKENEIGTAVVEASIRIHRELGPGLLESVYEIVLAHDLKERGFKVERQVTVPLKYRGLEFDVAFKADLVVNDLVIV
jgi:GxxExxY protein